MLVSICLPTKNREALLRRVESQDSPRLPHARCEMQDCPRLPRQALYLQTFRHYGIKPGSLELLAFVRMGLHLRTLKTLAGIYLRKA
jgi:hypothetical protein